MYGCQHLLLKFVLYAACKLSSTECQQLSGFPTSHKIRLYIYIALCCKLRVNHIQSVHIRTVISEFICEFCNLEHCTHLFTFTFQFVATWFLHCYYQTFEIKCFYSCASLVRFKVKTRIIQTYSFNQSVKDSTWGTLQHHLTADVCKLAVGMNDFVNGIFFVTFSVCLI